MTLFGGGVGCYLDASDVTMAAALRARILAHVMHEKNVSSGEPHSPLETSFSFALKTSPAPSFLLLPTLLISLSRKTLALYKRQSSKDIQDSTILSLEGKASKTPAKETSSHPKKVGPGGGGAAIQQLVQCYTLK
uniref:Uncharacterized protein n=1 Tax=Sphaerodactylus townsendi TaxID=933632 RepID=A0ACB8FF91_9SAUR